MSADDDEYFQPIEGDIFEKLPVIVVFGTLAVAILGDAAGLGTATAPLVGLGFVVVLPLSFVFKDDVRRLFGRERDRADGPDPTNDALDTLQEMYARGELTEAEFERRTARILENENVEAVRERVEREEGETVASADATADRETERER